MELATTIFTFVLYFFVACVIIIHLPMVIPESLSLRYHAMNLGYLVGATFLVSYYLLLLLFVPIERSMRICTELAFKWATRMGLDVRTARNVHIMKNTGNAVVVMNHQSFFDPLPFLPLWKIMALSTLVYLGSEMRNHMFLRKALAAQEHTFLDRRCARTAMKTLMITSEKYFKNDKQNKILIFPEGERNMLMKDYTFLEFKPGAFRVAKSCNVPVIPVVISPLCFIDHQRHFFKRGRTIISVLEPVHPGDMSPDELNKKVKGLMQEEFIRLKEELVDGKPSISRDNNNECATTKKDV